MLKELQSVTAPYAFSSEHVQGPGGNTSFKQNGEILIKGSGFTFKDVAQNIGVVKLNNQTVQNSLHVKQQQALTEMSSGFPEVLESTPAGIKPSMEYEFHSLLNTYVVHTHSVYANVITCSNECTKLLSDIFAYDEYLLVPYVTPGYPIARALLTLKAGTDWPPVIFLKNHGIIIHGKTAEEVVEKYAYIEDKIKQHLNLPPLQEFTCHHVTESSCTIKAADINRVQIDLTRIEEELTQQVLIPDQSIFFRNKISGTNKSAEIFIDTDAQQIVINGSQKFIAAAVAMLQAVYYIKNNITALHLTADYIAQDDLDILHGLSSEKYRLSLLKN
jgi:rhamnose utilization protein RhaD (predicted bifunctional aldolase and dehydrogenase)